MVFFYIITFIFSFDTSVNTFPKKINNNYFVFSKLDILKNISEVYDLALIEAFWCDGTNYKKDKLNNLKLVCYSESIKKVNLDTTNSFLNTYNINSQYEFKNIDDLTMFQIYFYLKKNYFRKDICLIKEQRKFFIKYFGEDIKYFKDKSKNIIDEYNKLPASELVNNYLFFKSYFTTKCKRDIFYYQASLYGFYDLEKLLVKNYWTK